MRSRMTRRAFLTIGAFAAGITALGSMGALKGAVQAPESPVGKGPGPAREPEAVPDERDLLRWRSRRRRITEGFVPEHRDQFP